MIAYEDLLLNKIEVSGCYVAGVPDRLIKETDQMSIYNLKDECDPVCSILGNPYRFWDIKVGVHGKLDINRHKISSYIDYLREECDFNESGV